MKIKLLFTLFLISLLGNAQDSTFSKVFHSPNDAFAISAQAISRDYNDGLIIAANSGYWGSGDGFILSIDSLGDLNWIQKYDYNSNGSALYNYDNIIKTKDSCLIVSGVILNSNTSEKEAYCLKIDQSGNKIWSKEFETSSSFEVNNVAISETADSGFVLSWGQSDDLLHLVKIDHDGNLLWSKEYMAVFAERVNKIIELNDSSLIIAGHANAIPEQLGMICKFDKNGNDLWTEYYEKLLFDDIIQEDSIFIAIGKNTDTYDLGFCHLNDTGAVILNRSDYNMWYDSYDHRYSIMPFQDSMYIMTNESDEMGWTWGSAVVVNDTGIVIKSASFNMYSAFSAATNNKGAWFVGNGPLQLIKTLWNPHIGVIRTDSMLTTSVDNFCYYVNDFIAGASEFPIVQYHNNLVPNGTFSSFDPLENISLISLDSYIGCVDAIGGLDEMNELEINVYPNVSTGIFNFELNETQRYQLIITDISGKEIQCTPIEASSFTADLSTEKSGIYFYKVVSSDGRSTSGKLMLMK